jgi:hypothetical protein
MPTDWPVVTDGLTPLGDADHPVEVDAIAVIWLRQPVRTPHRNDLRQAQFVKMLGHPNDMLRPQREPRFRICVHGPPTGLEPAFTG